MTELTTTNWKEADEAYGRGQQAYLDWCKAIAKLYADGTATQEQIAGRYDVAQQGISQAIAVGQDKRLTSNTSIPKSTYATYLLTTLPDKEFEEMCKPTTTQATILAYKARLKTPREAPKPASNYPVDERFKRPPCPGIEGRQVGQWVWERGNWFVVQDLTGKASGIKGTPQVQTRSVMQFLQAYISDTTNENRIELLKTIRRLEHPDRGGDNALVVEINLILDKEN